MTRETTNLTEGPVFSKMVFFVIPVLLTGLVQRLFNAADILLAGWLGTGGNQAVAAVGSTTALTGLMVSFFIGCSGGSAVKLSHAIGRGKEEEISKTIHTAVLLSVVMGGVLTVLGFAGSEWMLRLMDTPEALIGQSSAYLKTYFLGMIPYMVYNFGAAILQSLGESRKPFYYLLISGPAKLVLTVLFVSGWKMGVTGLALATTCSQIISAFLVCWALMKRRDACRLFWKKLRIHKDPLKGILKLGIPAGIQSATFSLSSVITQASVNSLSHLEGFLAGNAASVSIESFADAITSAFFQTGISFVGQNVGARRYDRVRKIYRYLCLMAVVFVGMVSILVCLFPKALLGLYLDGDPMALHWGTMRLRFFFSPLIFQGLMDATGGCIRGFGVSFSSMMIALVGICGFRSVWMLTIFRMTAFHTPACLYIVYPLSWVIAYLADLMLYRNVYKRAIKMGL